MSANQKQIKIEHALSEGAFLAHAHEPDFAEKARAKLIEAVLKTAMDFVEITETKNPREFKATLTILSDKPIKTTRDDV